MLLENPFLPSFIISEINRNPEKIIAMMGNAGIKPQMILEVIDAQLKKENITSITAQDFIANLIGLCVFPFAAKPIFQGLMFGGDNKAYIQFLENRKKTIPQFLLTSISK